MNNIPYKRAKTESETRTELIDLSLLDLWKDKLNKCTNLQTIFEMRDGEFEEFFRDKEPHDYLFEELCYLNNINEKRIDKLKELCEALDILNGDKYLFPEILEDSKTSISKNTFFKNQAMKGGLKERSFNKLAVPEIKPVKTESGIWSILNDLVDLKFPDDFDAFDKFLEEIRSSHAICVRNSECSEIWEYEPFKQKSTSDPLTTEKFLFEKGEKNLNLENGPRHMGKLTSRVVASHSKWSDNSFKLPFVEILHESELKDVELIDELEEQIRKRLKEYGIITAKDENIRIENHNQLINSNPHRVYLNDLMKGKCKELADLLSIIVLDLEKLKQKIKNYSAKEFASSSDTLENMEERIINIYRSYSQLNSKKSKEQFVKKHAVEITEVMSYFRSSKID